MYVNITKTGENNSIIKNRRIIKSKYVTYIRGERLTVKAHIKLFHYAIIINESAAEQSLHESNLLISYFFIIRNIIT